MRRERQLLGPGGTGSISSLISGMTLHERRQLNEAIKRRILREGGNDSDEPVTGSGGAQIVGGGRNDEKGVYYIEVIDNAKNKWEISVPDKGMPYILDLSNPTSPNAYYRIEKGSDTFYPIYIRLQDETRAAAGARPISGFLEKPVQILTNLGYLKDSGGADLPKVIIPVGGSRADVVNAGADGGIVPASPAPAVSPPPTTRRVPSYIGADAGPGVFKIPDEKIVAGGAPIGLEIFDSAGNILIVKTQQGWRVRAKLADDEVLAMVVPAAREEVARGLRLRGAGQEYDILKRNLIDQTNANKETELTLRREGNYWIDPLPISDEKAQEIIDQLGDALRVKRDVWVLSTSSGSLVLGDASFVISDDNTVRIKIPPSENNAGFVDIFGADKNIDAAIAKTQRRIGKDKPLRIPVAGATERSIIRMMTPSILGPLGIGAITFTPDSNGMYISNPIKMSDEQMKKFRELFSSVKS